MKTDSIFYQIFLKFPQSFFDLIGSSSTQVANYQFTSREVKQLSFRLDGLFIPTQEESNLPLYLVEVQFQPDEDFYYRLFAEIFLFLKQYKPPNPWQIVVIYPSRQIERQQSLNFSDFLSLSSLTRIYLDELGETADNSLGVGMIKLVVESEEKAVSQAKGLISKTQTQLTDPKIKEQLIDLIESIIVYKLPQKSREEIEAMFQLSDLKQTKVYQEALAEGEEKGLLIGRQQGREEGRQQGEANLILLILESRLGEIPSSLREQIQGLSIEHIENLGKAVLNFNTSEDLRNWLSTHH